MARGAESAQDGAAPAAMEGQAEEQPSQASSSSFYIAMRILPKDRREAMFAIYDFCREVDDIADDGDAPAEIRAAQLEDWRQTIRRLYAGEVPTGVAYLADPIERYGLREADFIAVIDGMEMDLGEGITAPDWQTLDLYCDRVASAVGRLSVKVFGIADDRDGIDLAYHLGRALQLTNILRDVDEDAELGRLYLPREALVAAGIHSTDPATVAADPRLDTVCRPVAARAREHYAAADAVMKRLPGAQVRAPRLMGAVYRIYLDKMEQAGWAPPRAEARIPKARLLWVAVRHGLIG